MTQPIDYPQLRESEQPLLEQLLSFGHNLEGEQLYVQHLDALNDLGECLLQAKTMEQALQMVTACLQIFITADRVSFCEPQTDNFNMRITGLVGVPSGSEGAIIPMRDGGLEDAFYLQQTDYFPDLRCSTVPIHQSLAQAGLRQAWSIPILGHGKTVAVLNIATHEKKPRHQHYLSTFKTLSRLLGATLQRTKAESQAGETIKLLVDDNPMMLAGLNGSGTIQRLSRFGANLLGYSEDALLGKPFCTLYPDNVKPTLAIQLKYWNALVAEQVDVCELPMLLKNGRQRWVKHSARRIVNANGAANILIVCEDIHELRELTTNLYQNARLDLLTQLPNRLSFKEHLHHAVRQAQDNEGAFSVFYLDLANFKNINDTLGHSTGDAVLKVVAQRLYCLSEHFSCFARIGGDEFLALLPNCTAADKIAKLSQLIIDSIRVPIKIADHALHIGCSIGISRYPQDGQYEDDLIKFADIAMYQSKACGHNGHLLFSAQLAESLERRMRLENDLRHALQTDNQQLTLVYQPQYGLASSEVSCVEALIRWHHPTLGPIAPDDFIPVAETTGQIERLTDWVLHTALSELAQLHKHAPTLRVAVNVSAIDFSGHSDIYDRVKRALKSHNMAATCLELELTETALLKHPVQAAETILLLNKLGVRIAIDDFGTGYASLTQLVNLPINAIKIDRSFVDNIENDIKKQAVVAGIIRIANNLGVHSIGEGVENKNQLQWLRNTRCDQVQGYLLSRPVPLTQLYGALAQCA